MGEMIVRKKAGKPPKFVKDRRGKEIFGLSFKSDGRYYATFSNPRKYFGNDFDSAVATFKAWESQQKGERVSINVPIGKGPFPKTVKWDEIQFPVKGVFWSQENEIGIEIGRGDIIELDTDIIWNKVRELILNDPVFDAKSQAGK
jgi:hypothetical protein